ncbi:MAG: deoxyribodipyrimidine photolyase, partial [Deltaproteobacteria bacterium]|nr:deoxyribodipyrimidine photolyase [Deltaproteobacteria bacterium]
LPGLGRVRLRGASAHRWRYALVTHALGASHLHDPQGGIAVCGDGLAGPRAGSALSSGVAAAKSLLG